MRPYIFVLCFFVLFMAKNAMADEGRNVELLASSCATCHGTRGHSVGGTPSLAGLNKLYFIQQMKEFKSGNRSSTVMVNHASGYTDEEIELLASYFSKQVPR